MQPADLWVEWHVAASVERLRWLLPGLVSDAGYRVAEVESVATHAGWGQFAVETGRGRIGIVRAQDEVDGSSEVVIASASADGRVELNRAALALYVGLVARGLLAPPPPLDTPREPLISPEA